MTERKPISQPSFSTQADIADHHEQVDEAPSEQDEHVQDKGHIRLRGSAVESKQTKYMPAIACSNYSAMVAIGVRRQLSS